VGGGGWRGGGRGKFFFFDKVSPVFFICEGIISFQTLTHVSILRPSDKVADKRQ